MSELQDKSSRPKEEAEVDDECDCEWIGKVGVSGEPWADIATHAVGKLVGYFGVKKDDRT